MTSELGITGGWGTTSPGIAALKCFAQTHNHDPGFGNFFAQAWVDIINDAKSCVGGGLRLPGIRETDAVFFTQITPILNDQSFERRTDEEHKGVNPEIKGVIQDGDDVCWNGTAFVWDGAPISKIPMQQMAAGNARYGTVYGAQTGTISFTSLAHLDKRYFENFPAVVGALKAWRIAKRALSRQGCLVIGNAEMPDPTVIETPTAGSALETANHDLFRYYRGLYKFLMREVPQTAAIPAGVDRKIMSYHTGLLMRSPEVSVVDENSAAESFVWDGRDIFKMRFTGGDFDENLSAILKDAYEDDNPPPPGLNDPVWDFSKYSPMRGFLDKVHALHGEGLQGTPEQHESWLPHGIYGHYLYEDTANGPKNHLALLLSNPWGVRHIEPGVSQEMNPFTFLFQNPGGSSGTACDYTVTFDPADYDNFPSSWKYTIAKYDESGALVGTAQTSALQTGASTLPTARVEPFEYVVILFHEG